MIFLMPSWLKEEWVGAKGESFDITGSLLYAISLFAIMYGFSQFTPPYGQADLWLLVFICLVFLCSGSN